MSKNINEYVTKYILICNQLCKKEADYTKENVKKHNKAMKELIMLREQMYVNMSLTKRVYEVLLEHEDSYVQQSAATDCLNLNIYIAQSVKILKGICRHGNNMSSMEAKRALSILKGEIGPEDPF